VTFHYFPNSWKVAKILMHPKSMKHEIYPKMYATNTVRHITKFSAVVERKVYGIF